LSGILAGLLGIGGGLILGPLLLELGLHPIVSTATTNFLVLFTSSSTSIQFFLLVKYYIKIMISLKLKLRKKFYFCNFFIIRNLQ